MQKIVWEQSFSVGIEYIDNEHKVLIDMFNALVDAKALDVNSEKVSITLNGMIDYAKTHFAHEEELLTNRGFPLLREHKLEHAGFLRRTVELCMEVSDHQLVAPENIVEFLGTWIVHHICEEDQKYAHYFANHK